MIPGAPGPSTIETEDEAAASDGRQTYSDIVPEEDQNTAESGQPGGGAISVDLVSPDPNENTDDDAVVVNEEGQRGIIEENVREGENVEEEIEKARETFRHGEGRTDDFDESTITTTSTGNESGNSGGRQTYDDIVSDETKNQTESGIPGDIAGDEVSPDPATSRSPGQTSEVQGTDWEITIAFIVVLAVLIVHLTR